ncbi:MAG: hypothetical protein IJL47_07185 [Lachnospiraceae bacterium]|nr:hypothetical protein [Lachnospiraceae bacterium]MBQ6195848.1 hypothetical protein [Lachnospiraceae bacterium]
MEEYIPEISCIRFFDLGCGICQEISTAYSYLLMQAGALIELSGDVETAFKIYYEEYDIHELPSISLN